MVKTLLYPMATHLRDHLLNYYLTEAHTAVDDAQKEELIPEEAEDQAKLIVKVQQIIEQQLGQFSEQLAALDKEAQKVPSRTSDASGPLNTGRTAQQQNAGAGHTDSGAASAGQDADGAAEITVAASA